VRADAIHTDTTGLSAGDAKIKVADGEMPAYYARPASGQNPPVVLVAMEIFGLHEYIKDVTRRLAKLGHSRSRPITISGRGKTSPKSARCKS
jgi:carboxymethylenebutenolidase